MDLEKYNQRILSSDKADVLKKLSESPTGKAVAGMLEEEKLMEAIRRGDGRTLKNALQGILSTREGKRLAAEVKKAVEQHGG